MNARTAPWSARPVVGLGELGPLGPPVSEGAGESLGIYPLPRMPGWLVKLYHHPGDRNDRERLDRLVALPDTAPPPDRDVLRRHTSWPVARVVDSFGYPVGVVLPVAPSCFTVPGTGDYLEVDLLAKPDHAIARRRLPVPSPDDRLAICASIAAVGAALERQSLVYSDWSYSNAFWSPAGRVAYVIDVDGVGLRSKPNMHQPNWQDPLTPADHPADGYTDRYRLALLVARCLTGERDAAAVLHALARLPGLTASEVLLDALLSEVRTRRPTVSALHAALLGLPYQRMPVPRAPMPGVPPSVPAVSAGDTRRTDAAPAPAPPAPANPGRPAGPTPAVVVAITVVLVLLTIALLAVCAGVQGI